MSASFVRGLCPNCGPASLFRYGVCVTRHCGYQLQPAPVTHPDFRYFNNQIAADMAARNKKRAKTAVSRAKSHSRRYEV